jgi:predicted PurR-regulated permease PerM
MKNLKKINHFLIFILALSFLLYFGSPFLIPFIFGIFFATLMTPFSKILEQRKINRLLTSFISTLAIFIVVGGILYIFILQINLLLSEVSTIGDRIISIFQDIQKRIVSLTDLSLEEQKNIWENRSAGFLKTIESALTSFLGNIVSTLVGFLLVLVYTFLLLYYRRRFLEFVLWYVEDENKGEIKKILNEISGVVYHYLWGRVKVMSILGAMYYITFLIFNLPYAGLLTIFGALITIIPYLGPFISGILPVLFAIIFIQDFNITLVFTIIILIEQLIESYVLEPVIIGKEVQINPLIVIIAIATGGLFWGLAGMILFVPMFAIIKIISKYVPVLRPVGHFFATSNNGADKK